MSERQTNSYAAVRRPGGQERDGSPYERLRFAVLKYDRAIRRCANDPDLMSSYCTADGDDLDALYMEMLQACAHRPGGAS